MMDGGAGCITLGNPPHSAREVPCAPRREAIAGMWLSLSEDVINADCCLHFSGGSLASTSAAVSQPTTASLKGMGGKANILQVLYCLLISADKPGSKILLDDME